jgi:hypothetical protein
MRNYLPYDQANPQTWYPIYLTTEVIVVGGNQVENMASRLLKNPWRD